MNSNNLKSRAIQFIFKLKRHAFLTGIHEHPLELRAVNTACIRHSGPFDRHWKQSCQWRLFPLYIHSPFKFPIVYVLPSPSFLLLPSSASRWSAHLWYPKPAIQLFLLATRFAWATRLFTLSKGTVNEAEYSSDPDPWLNAVYLFCSALASPLWYC